MNWRCGFGIHDWRILSVSPWGHYTWHTWAINRECRICGDFQRRFTENERTAKADRRKMEVEDVS